jgi:HD-GYP domain-containing protein (c-di-GMP phosphodiesterase class II)
MTSFSIRGNIRRKPEGYHDIIAQISDIICSTLILGAGTVANPRNSGIRQAEIIVALSLATDLGTGHPMEWALNSALLGIRLGEVLGLDEQALREIYYVALLRYIGCTADIETRVDLFGDDPAVAGSQYAFMDVTNPNEMMAWIDRYVGQGKNADQRMLTMQKMPTAMPTHIRSHCEVAQFFVERLGFSGIVQDSIQQTYERWDGLGMPNGLKTDDLTLVTRITQLAQDVEAYRRAGRDEEIVTVVEQRANTAYDPDIAEIFCRHADELMAGFEQEISVKTILAAEPGEHRYLTDEEFDAAALVMADFIDLLSPSCHSRTVASLAASAGQAYGLPSSDVKALERMGWLHDIGKISVPAGIWTKTRSLTGSEWERVRLHPYYTERILAHSPLLSQLGTCAALHHERLDGSGYHRGMSGNTLSPTARILAAANFYAARVEPRPFRPALSPENAAEELRKEIRAGKLDSDAGKAVLSAAGHRVAPVRQDRVAGLSEREIEVLRLITQGYSNRQMGESLKVAETTIGTHIAHIYDKLNVSTRAAATLFAIQNGLL